MPSAASVLPCPPAPESSPSYLQEALLPIQAVARKLEIPEKYFEQLGSSDMLLLWFDRAALWDSLHRAVRLYYGQRACRLQE